MLKRLLDIFVSIIVLAISMPLFGVIAVLIKADSSGPVFYRGLRVGLKGTLFHILKFRTMIDNAENLGGSATANDDPRITRIGQVLRRYKLDEIPQLINVLIGEMSLVGPRPEVQQYVNMYTEEEKSILTVRPGITDWASLWDFDEGMALAGCDDPEKKYVEKIRPEKIKLQLEYVRHKSLWIDCKILFFTLVAVVFRIHVYKGIEKYE